MPVTKSNILLNDFCCHLDNCYESAEIVSGTPYVERVYVQNSKYFSSGDLITVNVAFSAPIYVVGTVKLRIKFVDITAGMSITFCDFLRLFVFNSITMCYFFRKTERLQYTFRFICTSFEFDDIELYFLCRNT